MESRRLHVLLAGLSGIATLALVLAFVVVPGINTDFESPVSTHLVAPAPNAPAEGISVQGHWTLEVRNPDGSLVERCTFENALMDDGKIVLSRILGRLSSVGGWSIRLEGPVGRDPFLSSGALPSNGFIVENSYSGTGSGEPYMFKNLTVATESSGSVLKLVLAGTATAQREGVISSVMTGVCLLPSTQPPSSAYGSSMTAQNPLTAATLPSTISVITGQSIMVTVEISFS